MNPVQKAILAFIVTVIGSAVLAVGFLVYDIVTSIRAWMKRRETTIGKEEQ